MRSCTIAFSALIGLAACSGPQKPAVVYKTQEVLKEVPVYCQVDVPPTAGPDFAPAESDIWDAAVYAEGRIIALRTEVFSLRRALSACAETSRPDTQ